MADANEQYTAFVRDFIMGKHCYAYDATVFKTDPIYICTNATFCTFEVKEMLEMCRNCKGIEVPTDG